MSMANIVSTCRNRWARTIRKARPSWAASSSATTSISHAGGQVDAGDVDDAGVAVRAGSPGAARVSRPAPERVATRCTSSWGTARATSAIMRML